MGHQRLVTIFDVAFLVSFRQKRHQLDGVLLLLLASIRRRFQDRVDIVKDGWVILLLLL